MKSKAGSLRRPIKLINLYPVGSGKREDTSYQYQEWKSQQSCRYYSFKNDTWKNGMNYFTSIH